ncbi:hypothetical protein ABK040_014653 [Willaertia magna]
MVSSTNTLRSNNVGSNSAHVSLQNNGNNNISLTSLNSSQTSNLDRSTQSLVQQPISQTQNTVSSSGAQDITLAQGEANAYLQFSFFIFFI